MKNNPLEIKHKTKKSAVKAVWVIVFFITVFVIVITKFALSDLKPINEGELPDSDVAYTIAKHFIKPTIRSKEVDFSDSEYKFAKKSDSVYVIKSHYSEKFRNGENLNVNFVIYLKYKGGLDTRPANWELIKFSEVN